ncbi:Phthiocerol synthesis polyketide synthase type I PpsD [Symbiodinium microadriaticum]|uniref:Phthiocerol synthesis polyketide synthase type I PpsD n=1 Tax=Symbiodinium microadriaticum TaxID=2951 RepID=A0A1Q9E433_SYMMI|nr:Phthiocerol synthesis polyketide synthase type I PpsD [Symbiodinium microadriaticum]
MQRRRQLRAKNRKSTVGDHSRRVNASLAEAEADKQGLRGLNKTAWGASQALAIQWGPWAEDLDRSPAFQILTVGMAAATETLERQQVVAAAAINWARYLCLGTIECAPAPEGTSGSGGGDPSERWLHGRHFSVLLSLISVSRRRLLMHGLDSLAAVELRNRLSRMVFDYPTASTLASFLKSRMAPPAAAETGAVPEAGPSVLQADLQSLRRSFSRLYASLEAGACTTLSTAIGGDRPDAWALFHLFLNTPMQIDAEAPVSDNTLRKEQREDAMMNWILRNAVPADEKEAHLMRTLVLCIKGGPVEVHQVPIERWDVSMYFGEDNTGGRATLNVDTFSLQGQHGSFMDGLELFDADHFGMSASEAIVSLEEFETGLAEFLIAPLFQFSGLVEDVVHACKAELQTADVSKAAGMGPAQRQVLEVAAESLHPLQGSPDIAVVVGSTQHDWMLLQEPAACTSVYGGLAINGAVLANRISYNFALRGPSFVVRCPVESNTPTQNFWNGMEKLKMRSIDREEVDTACSSALVAVDAACRFGAVVSLVFVLYSLAQMPASELSRAGRCFTFNATAEGYVRGEGIGALQLSADEAKHAEGHLLGSAVNSDGRSASFTAPSGLAQEEMLLAALRAWDGAGGHSAPSIVETHGTGTALGDPIEVARPGIEAKHGVKQICKVGALYRVFRLLSSSKTGLGHGEALAGVPGSAPGEVMNAHFDLRCADGSGCLAYKCTCDRADWGFNASSQVAPAVLDGKLFDVQWTEWREIEDFGSLPANLAAEVKSPGSSLVLFLRAGRRQGCLSFLGAKPLPRMFESGRGNAGARLQRSIGGLSCGSVAALGSPDRRSGSGADAGLLAEEIFELLALSAALCRSRVRAELVDRKMARLSLESTRPSKQVTRWCQSDAHWLASLVRLSWNVLTADAMHMRWFRACDPYQLLMALRWLLTRERPWPPLSGWHLVSGGTGGIGLLAAQALARQAEAELWQKRFGTGIQGVIAKQAPRVGLGGSRFEREFAAVIPQNEVVLDGMIGWYDVLLLSDGDVDMRVRVDVSSLEAMEAVMQQLPELSGVVHAAQAPLGYRDLAGQSRETFLGEYSVRFPFARYLLGPLA